MTEPSELSEPKRRVYFAVSGREVKIGVARDPTQRLEVLRKANPNITLLGDIPGNRETERRLHQRFSEDRIAGEWFRFTAKVEAAIKNLLCRGNRLRVRDAWAYLDISQTELLHGRSIKMLKTKIPTQFSTEDWKRLPEPRERLCHLSRTTLLELNELGEITIAAIRKPGSQKAIRLVYMPSLHQYLRTCIEESVPKPLKTRPSKIASRPTRVAK